MDVCGRERGHLRTDSWPDWTNCQSVGQECRSDSDGREHRYLHALELKGRIRTLCLRNDDNMNIYPDVSVYWPICAWSNNADGRTKDDPGYATVCMCLRTNTDEE